jgi:hypothetical protein
MVASGVGGLRSLKALFLRPRPDQSRTEGFGAAATFRGETNRRPGKRAADRPSCQGRKFQRDHVITLSNNATTALSGHAFAVMYFQSIYSVVIPPRR